MRRDHPEEAIDWSVKATIWHETRRGVIRFNVAFTKRCGGDERWWDSTCFQLDDMPALSRLATDAHAWIAEQSKDLEAFESDDPFDGTS